MKPLLLALSISSSTVTYSQETCLKYREAAVTFEAATQTCMTARDVEQKNHALELEALEARARDCEAAEKTVVPSDSEPWYGGPVAAIILMFAFAGGVAVGIGVR